MVGKRGPPRTPTAVKRALHMASARNEHRNTLIAPPIVQAPEAPAHLGILARAEWDRVCDLMTGIGLLTELDLAVLAVYCDTFERWRMVSDILSKLAADEPKTRGLVVVSKGGATYENPLVSQQRALARDLVRYAQVLGLTPSARSGIALDPMSPLAPKRKGDKLAETYGLAGPA